MKFRESDFCIQIQESSLKISKMSELHCKDSAMLIISIKYLNFLYKIK